ncbi:hypothetical protein Unana1_05785 [Umbelopsis nana]
MLCTTRRCFSAFPELPLPSPIQLQFANKLFKQPATFVKSIANVDQAPTTTIPEGHTRLINFFSIGDKLHLVDMPGYGFRSREEWGESIMSYLTAREQLKRTFVLIDSTVGIKPADQQLFEYFDKLALSYQVILTKRDRVSEKKFQENKHEIEASLFKQAICCYPQLLASGQQRKSRRGANQAAIIDEGIQDIRWAIVNAAGVYSPPQPENTSLGQQSDP